MRKRFGLTAVIIFSMICAGPAFGFNVSVIPDFQTIGTGEEAMFDLNISGLGDGVSPSLGAFDVNIFYDENVLDFRLPSVVFSDFLGPSNQFVSLFPGRVWLGEVSFMGASQLNVLQPSAFTMVSFSFWGLNAGETSLNFNPVTLSDENGLLLAELTLSKDVTVIPLPAAIVLLASGLGGIAVIKKKLNHNRRDKNQVL